MNTPIQALANAITEKFILACPQEAAKALEPLATHEVLLLVGALKAQTLVVCLNSMAPAKAAAVLRRLPLKQASYILTHLEVPQAARLMQEFSAPYRQRISAVLEPAFLKLLQEASAYAPGSAGQLMSTDFISVRTETKLSQLVERLKTWPRNKLPAVCFVTDKAGELKGLIHTAELAFYKGEHVCGSVMTPCEGVLPSLAGDALAAAFGQRGEEVLPVCNADGILLGSLSRWATAEPPAEKPFWKKWTR